MGEERPPFHPHQEEYTHHFEVTTGKAMCPQRTTFCLYMGRDVCQRGRKGGIQHLALNTGASSLGLEPMRRMKSACSKPIKEVFMR